MDSFQNNYVPVLISCTVQELLVKVMSKVLIHDIFLGLASTIKACSHKRQTDADTRVIFIFLVPASVSTCLLYTLASTFMSLVYTGLYCL